MKVDSIPLKGKVALVTGSTSGIGQGIARALGEAGADIALHGLGDPEQIERERRGLQDEANVRVMFFAADASRPAEIEGLVAAVERELGGVDILVNNAGLQYVSAVDEFPPDKWQLLQDVILNSSFRAIRAAVPGMKRRGWGRIINLVSAHGLVASPFKSAYVSAKHGLVGLTKTVALELAEKAITCNAICPGYVRTPLVEAQIDQQAKVHSIPRDQVIRDVILASQPSRRFVEIAEVAALAVFLCGEEARSITGASIPVDGGWTAR